MRRTAPPSGEIQASIDKLMSRGMVDDPQKMLGELARLGARLIIQRAVEEEFDEFLNPDQEVNILRGRLAILRGDGKQAQGILAAVTRVEPMNVDGWIWFTGANLGDPRESRVGTARLAQPDPIDAGHARR